MKTIVNLLLIILATATIHLSAMTTEEKQIDDILLNGCDDYWSGWLKEKVTEEQILREDDAFSKRYMDLFKKTLQESGLGDRQDLIESRLAGFEGWRRRRAVFLNHLRSPGIGAYRYDGGENEPCGYVLIRDGAPFRILSLRINRPDPNIGNVQIPFPYLPGKSGNQ